LRAQELAALNAQEKQRLLSQQEQAQGLQARHIQDQERLLAEQMRARALAEQHVQDQERIRMQQMQAQQLQNEAERLRHIQIPAQVQVDTVTLQFPQSGQTLGQQMQPGSHQTGTSQPSIISSVAQHIPGMHSTQQQQQQQGFPPTTGRPPGSEATSRVLQNFQTDRKFNLSSVIFVE